MWLKYKNCWHIVSLRMSKIILGIWRFISEFNAPREFLCHVLHALAKFQPTEVCTVSLFLSIHTSNALLSLLRQQSGRPVRSSIDCRLPSAKIIPCSCAFCGWCGGPRMSTEPIKHLQLCVLYFFSCSSFAPSCEATLGFLSTVYNFAMIPKRQGIGAGAGSDSKKLRLRSRSFWSELEPCPEALKFLEPELEPNPEPHDRAGAGAACGVGAV
jgi:hypothetical protein